MKLIFFAFLGLVATTSGEDSASPSNMPTKSVIPTSTSMPSEVPSKMLSKMPTVTNMPSEVPSTSDMPTLTTMPSNLRLSSDMPSDTPTSSSSYTPTSSSSLFSTLESTERCTDFCEQDAVTEFCGGEITGSYCKIQDSSDSSDSSDGRSKCKDGPLCVCECPDGGVYYEIEFDYSDSSDSSKIYFPSPRGKPLCGRDPDCDKSQKSFGDICFSPIATTSVYGKGRVMMKDLMNGDSVLTMDGSYQTMYSMNHYDKSKEVTFVQIKTNLESEQPLELSPNHLLYVDDNTNPVPASSVEVGDKVWTVEGGKEVLEINMITRDGLYNPLTMDGTIIVDGIAASVYTTPTGKTHVDIDGVWSAMTKSLSFHDALHMVTAPYRQFCTAVSLDLCNLHQKKSAASSFMESFFFPFWSNQNDFVKFVIASSYMLVFGTLANLTYFKVWVLLANACAFSKMTIAKKAAA